MKMNLFISILFSISAGLVFAEDVPFETPPTTNPMGSPSPNGPGGLESFDTDGGPPLAQPLIEDTQSEKLYGDEEKKQIIKSEVEQAKAPTKAQLANLGQLSEFKDIAVIGRRFLPKTSRFELSSAAGLVLNDAFFNNLAFSGRAGYYFTEKYGVELMGIFLSTTSKGITEGLSSERGLNTTSLVTPKGFYGASFKWAPIYGKMGFLNKTIVPFDTYFLAGAGVTMTNQDTSPPTLHLGTGQIYSIKKWWAARWDFTWLGYNSTTKVPGESGGFFSNLYITIGMSFFIPEAKYR